MQQKINNQAIKIEVKIARNWTYKKKLVAHFNSNKLNTTEIKDSPGLQIILDISQLETFYLGIKQT